MDLDGHPTPSPTASSPTVPPHAAQPHPAPPHAAPPHAAQPHPAPPPAGGDPSYDEQYEAVWAELDDIEPEDFVARIDSIDAPAEIAAFERAAARDSTGHSDLAVPLYREALAGGVIGLRRRRAVIQLASSLRNLGELDESLALLTAETDAGDDELDVALAAFRALTLASLGREREGLAQLLEVLAPTLPRYQRSVGAYARALLD